MKYIQTERVLEIARQHFGINHASAAATLFENFATDLETEIIEHIESDNQQKDKSNKQFP